MNVIAHHGVLDIRTGHRVTSVSWTLRGVSVATDRGTVEADRAVITLPLGVLQRGAVEFSPELPAAKVRAIQALGMGTLNKPYLRFPKSFWPAKYDWLEYLSSERGRWCEWIGGFERYAKQLILLGFNAGRFGADIEAGEASSVDSPSTVHGAYESGQDAAEAVLARNGSDRT
jgi:hypothetical protein